mmetsp:Transcript_32746/g.33085  ORF Transcript_32746/g.33085 Transcript_32746/m.33085 type:complete len:129 (-) Transcript_32746:74-460(-)
MSVVIDAFGQSEIKEFGVLILIKPNIVGFQITKEDGVGVEMVKRRSDAGYHEEPFEPQLGGLGFVEIEGFHQPDPADLPPFVQFVLEGARHSIQYQKRIHFFVVTIIVVGVRVSVQADDAPVSFRITA